jgi:Raf kinase inhibitor-like YbhB/YbcL family protein
MKLISESFENGKPIPAEFAFCRIDPKSHVTLSSNRNPHLAWSDAPVGTRSFAIVCHDPDVPGSPEDVNQEGREIPSTLKRIEFFHWILVDLPASVDAIAAGEFSDNVTPKGKSGPAARHGARQGINDYTAWFADDHDMAGDYHGYDGPCPPWNDSIVHRYVFTVYALDVERLPLMGRFTGADARKVIAHHRLGEASITGTYTLNPRLATASA